MRFQMIKSRETMSRTESESKECVPRARGTRLDFVYHSPSYPDSRQTAKTCSTSNIGLDSLSPSLRTWRICCYVLSYNPRNRLRALAKYALLQMKAIQTIIDKYCLLQSLLSSMLFFFSEHIPEIGASYDEIFRKNRLRQHREDTCDSLGECGVHVSCQRSWRCEYFLSSYCIDVWMSKNHNNNNYFVFFFTQITVATVDRRKMPLVFKANIVDMDGKILVDFRLSKGCGIEFKRRFVKIKTDLGDLVAKGNVLWPTYNAARSMP